jgi:aminoglycoside phosphotransferase family enzyme/predicted kinase
MNPDPQQEIVDFLSRALGASGKVATHISIVLLGETRVYKLKRAVRLPYLDFSTPALRLGLCEREVELNKRFAPSLYLGVRRVTRETDGALALDGDGAFVDCVVEMRRFPDDALFDDMARAGRLTRDMIESLARLVAQSHDRAAPDVTRGGAQAMGMIIDSMEESFREAAPAPMAEISAHIARLRETLATMAHMIDTRRAAGKVRSCHGDLNLRNICLFDGVATPFDCIEFSEDISTIDVLYDLAFLLMDLIRVGLPAFANLAFNRYLDARAENEDEGLRLLPFFMSLRATIRAHVEASQGHDATACAYFDLSRALLAPAQGMIVAIGGFSGAGKSSVAAALAPRLAPAPGARVFNSDRIRKALFNVAPNTRLPAAAYTSEVSSRVYGALFDRAARVARAGWPVVVDAVFDRPPDRDAIAKAAGGAPFLSAWLDVDLAQRLARVDARINDVSDATRDVLTAQTQKETGDIAWRRIDASRDVDAIAIELAALSPVPQSS